MQSEPRDARIPVWALPRSLAATCGIDVSFSSSGYLDVSVHRVPLHTLWIGVWILEVCSSGFPHSDTSGSMDICSSPKLFAAYHVFHRLLVPSHPPCALLCLTSHIYSVICAGGFSLFSSLLLLLLSFIVLGFPSLSSDVLLINNCYLSDIFSLYAVFKVRLFFRHQLWLLPNGDGEIRTLDPLLARQVLSQLSYTPMRFPSIYKRFHILFSILAAT